MLGTLFTNWMSYSFHSYQSEPFPTRIRSRAVGFVYSWSRLSAALSGLVAFAMLIVLLSIGGFGPRTSGLALEAISH